MKPGEGSSGNASGYAHANYAASLSEYGTPRFLCHSGSWILERRISGSTYSDAMGCYPLFVCQNWSGLDQDLNEIGKDLVCLSLVADPFGEHDIAYLRKCFPDVTLPFKEHFVVDLSRSPETFVHSHHRRNARRALGEMQVEKCASPESYLEDWVALYSNLVAKHNITGLKAFSRESFAKQLQVPGMVGFRAVRDDVTLGMLLWYVSDKRAYYHLGAYSAAGYELGASFALFGYSLEYFAKYEFDWLNLGAGAGAVDGDSGLSRFKRGWSTGTRTAYFCGRIFNRERYEEIVKAQEQTPTKYFPAYRADEFG